MKDLAAKNGVDVDRLTIGKRLEAKGSQKARDPKDFKRTQY